MVGQNWIMDDGANRWLGVVEAVEFPNLVTLRDVSWVAESGRLSEFLKNGHTDHMEIEYLGPDSEVKVMMRAAIKWPHDLIRRTV